MSLSRSYTDYSLNFLSPNVWGTSDTYTGIINPMKQNALPIEITYRFAENTRLMNQNPEYDCTIPFGESTREIQRGIFADLNTIIPNKITFTEKDPLQQAMINFMACTNLPGVAGMSNLPNGGNLDTVIQAFASKQPLTSIETVFALYKILPIAFVSTMADPYKRTLMHETGHAMGLLHTHNNGNQGNPGLTHGFSCQSSIMSYEPNACGFSDITNYFQYPWTFLGLLTWAAVPTIRTSYGALDIANLQYAYNPLAPSVSIQQIDATFPCETFYPSALVLPLATSLWPAQVILGATFATAMVLASSISKKAEEWDYQRLAKVAYLIDKAFINFTPPEPSATATWRQAFQYALLDFCMMLPRVALPLSGLAFDITYSTGTATQNGGLLSGMGKLVSTTIINSFYYGLSRAIGYLPWYGLYTFAKNANTPESESPPESPPCCDPDACTTAKNIVRGIINIPVTLFAKFPAALVINARAMQHVFKGSRFERWVNPENDIPPSITQNDLNSPFLTEVQDSPRSFHWVNTP